MDREIFFEQLFRDHFRLVYQTCLNELYPYSQYQAIAKDATQEIFLLAYCRLDLLRLHPNPAGWLVSTAQNKCREFLRKENRRKTLLTTSEAPNINPDDTPEQWEHQRAMQETLRSLKDELTRTELEVFTALFENQMETAEAARYLGKTRDNIRKVKERILAKASDLHLKQFLLLIFAIFASHAIR